MKAIKIKQGQDLKEFFIFKENIGYRLNKSLTNLEDFCEISYRTNGTDVSVDLVFVIEKNYYGEKYKGYSEVIGKIPTTGKNAYQLQLYKDDESLFLN